MLYRYEATTPQGEIKTGSIEAANREIAIASLQRRNLIITSIQESGKGPFFSRKFKLFQRVKQRDIVILARQLSTLFDAKVPVLTSFQLLAAEMENVGLKEKLTELLNDIQGGTSISEAMSKHPDVFSKCFVSMVGSGEESGKLSEVFAYLASYLERNYELTSKAKSALIYPIFVLGSFIIVMVLMLTVVIPKLSSILQESGQQLPFYTLAIIGLSNFLLNFGVFILIALVLLGVGLVFYYRTLKGKMAFSRFQLSIPYIGNLYKKLYLSRLMDNFATLLSAGVSVVRTFELTSETVSNEVYRNILIESTNAIKGGASISDSLSRYEDMPGLVVQMIRVGEETGKLAFVLKTLATFYKKEVETVTETLLSLIEPALIILLGLGVGVVVAGVLGPIYSITASV